MNIEARAITLMMVNTDARPSEVAALSSERIRLNTEIPHIVVEPEARKLKSIYPDRVVPLVGVSLEAAKLCPE